MLIINRLPYKLRDVYILNSQLYSYATRRNNIYPTGYGYYSIQCKGTNLWNSIPEDLKNTKSHYNIARKFA